MSPGWAARRRRLVNAIALLGAALLTWLVAAPAYAVEPSASPIGGDPRSAGEGPGMVGEPLVAIVVVIGIGMAALLATLIWVRATSGRHGARRRD